MSSEDDTPVDSIGVLARYVRDAHAAVSRSEIVSKATHDAAQKCLQHQLDTTVAVSKLRDAVAALDEKVERRQLFPPRAAWIIATCAVVIALCFVLDIALSQQAQHPGYRQAEHQHEQHDQEPSGHMRYWMTGASVGQIRGAP